MGSGCLAPKPIIGDLIAQLIDQLHTPLQNTSKQSKYIQQTHNYKYQKQKLFKRASLKKLVDYLSSHRHKINDSLAYNLKASIQKGQSYNWIVALVILERIILMGKQTGNKIDHAQNILKSKRNLNKQMSQSSHVVLTSLRTQIFDKQNQSGLHYQQKSFNDSILKQLLSSRFESLMYNTIYTILNQEQLYKQCLRILGQYLQLDVGKLNSDQKLLELLGIMLNNLKVQYQTKITLEIYYRLIYRLKDKTILSICSYVKSITKIWLAKLKVIKSNSKLNYIQAAEEECSYLELIICQFFSSSLNGLQYRKMISILLQIYDQYNFQLPLQFQQMYIHVLNTNDLGQNFLKALFLQFLRYGILGSSKKGQLKDSIINELVTISNQKQLKNYRQYLTRMKLFQLIKRWLIQKNYIQLPQIIKYHSTLFIYCFILSFGEEYVFISSSFLEIVKKINQEEKIILLETIYQQYQKEQTYHKIRTILVALGRTISQLLQNIIIQNSTSRLVINIQYLTANQALQLYSSLISFYYKFDKDSKICYMQQICELLASTIGFFNNQEFNQYKIGLVKMILGFLQELNEIQSIIIAFYQKISRIIIRKFARGEQLQFYQDLKQGIVAIFKRYAIMNYQEQQFSTESENQYHESVSSKQIKNLNQFHTCKIYFKDLISLEGRSKIGMKQTGEFDKARSIINESSIKDQEQSFKDVLQMINL